jgi:hypothetical protein
MQPQSFPKELFFHIATFTTIADTRNFARSHPIINETIKPVIEDKRKQFLDMYSDISMTQCAYEDDYCVENFTIELCHAKYFHLIPLEYLHPDNSVIVKLLILNGQLELLKTAMNQGCELTNAYSYYNDEEDSVDEEYGSSYQAVISGDIEILKFVVQSGYKTNLTASVAARNNRFDMVKYLVESGCTINNDVLYFAAERGNIEMLEYSLNNLKLSGRDINKPSICESAIKRRQNHVINCLQSKGYIFPKETCKMAVEYNNFEFLEILVNDYKYELDKDTCKYAIEKSNIRVAKWAKEQGCYWNREEFLLQARTSNNNYIIGWLQSDDCPE